MKMKITNTKLKPSTMLSFEISENEGFRCSQAVLDMMGENETKVYDGIVSVEINGETVVVTIKEAAQHGLDEVSICGGKDNDDAELDAVLEKYSPAHLGGREKPLNNGLYTAEQMKRM